MRLFLRGLFALFIGCLLMSDIVYSSTKFHDLYQLLPAEMHQWRYDGKDKTYDPQTIFDYIDGAGEVYRAYNFLVLIVRRYERPNQPNLTVDLFDMGSADNAFGIFSF